MTYVIEHGDVWLRQDNSTRLIHVCSGSETLAIAYDCETGTMHKRGAYVGVKAWIDRTENRLRQCGHDDMADNLIIAEMPVCEKSIDLLNRCNDNSSTIEALIAAGELPGKPLEALR